MPACPPLPRSPRGVPAPRTLGAFAVASLACLLPAAQAASERILENVAVSGSQVYTQMTPVAVRDGHVFVATIEPGPPGDRPCELDPPVEPPLRAPNPLVLRLRHGVQGADGDWQWQDGDGDWQSAPVAVDIEERGVDDPWHTAPAVGVDDAGHVHVAYNMHNFPWQHEVSVAPLDVSAFDFRGQAITRPQLDRHICLNGTFFPDLGSADVPGNQITYPAFDNDRFGRLHLSYRFAAKPARDFEERTFSSGVARYDSAARAWTSLGGLLEHGPDDHVGPDAPEATLRAIASRTGWTSYAPRPTFDGDGAVTVTSMWRRGIAGAIISRPCAVTSTDGTSFTTLDGTAVTMPIVPDGSDACPELDSAVAGTDYYTLGDAAADEDGHPHLLLSPTDRAREIHRWTGSAWVVEDSPGYAVEIFFDDEWNLWAIAQGMSLYLRRAAAGEWETIVQAAAKDECLPHAALDSNDRSVAVVFSMGCTVDEIAVTRYDLRELRGDDPAGQSDLPALALARGAWRQVSLPFEDGDRTVADVFGGALPIGGYDASWAVYGYDAAAGSYFMPGIDDALETGRGYWIIQDVAATVTVDAPADAVPAAGSFDPACGGVPCTRVDLENLAGDPVAVGWNLGGAPVAGPVALSELRFARAGSGCGDGCTFDEAFAAGLAGPELFRYDADARAYDRLGAGARLEPWAGYWSAALPAADGGLRLLFPGPPAVQALVARPASLPLPVPRTEPPGPTRGPTLEDRGIDGA